MIPLCGERLPISNNETCFFKPSRVAFNGKDRDVGFNSLQNLIGDGFRSGKRRGEMHVLSVLRFPLR